MFNPLKMGSVEKRLLIGGIASGITYYGNLYAMNNVAGYPAQLKGRLDNHLPQNGDMLGSVAPPAILYIAKKVVKSTGTKEKLADMTLGSVLFSVPNLVKTVVVQAVSQTGSSATMRLATRSAPTMNMSKYVVQPNNMSARPSMSSGMSKYTITA